VRGGNHFIGCDEGKGDVFESQAREKERGGMAKGRRSGQEKVCCAERELRAAA
jgi:hypothetical protein